MKRAIRELGEQTEKFRGKSKRSTNHKSVEEAHYKENLELEGQSEDSGWSSHSEMLRDLEGEVRQEVIGVDSGGSSGSGSESLK